MKHTLLLCLLLVFGNIATAQVYDSAIRYKNSSLSFNVAMDTLIQRVTSPTDTGEGSQTNVLTLFKEFMGGRVSLDVPAGADMYAPMAGALSTYLSEIGSSCTSAGNWQCVGPFNNYYGTSDEERQGRINALWVDPSDTNIILAGAENIKNSLNLLVLC